MKKYLVLLCAVFALVLPTSTHAQSDHPLTYLPTVRKAVPPIFDFSEQLVPGVYGAARIFPDLASPYLAFRVVVGVGGDQIVQADAHSVWRSYSFDATTIDHGVFVFRHVDEVGELEFEMGCKVVYSRLSYCRYRELEMHGFDAWDRGQVALIPVNP